MVSEIREVESNYLPEFVYGGTDGAVTTLAAISAVVGASLSLSVILVIGFANLIADGFSMAVSDYLSTKSRNDLKSHQLGRKVNPGKSAFATFVSFFVIGFIPLLPFVVAELSGVAYFIKNQFYYSAAFTFVALGIVGWFRGEITKKNKTAAVIQTVLIGGVAAVIAFSVGYFIKSLLG